MEERQKDYIVHIVTRSEDLPSMKVGNFFHSPELFRITEKTSGSTPYMVVVTDCDGHVKAHMLATIYRRGSLLPLYWYSLGRVYGEGDYDIEVDNDNYIKIKSKLFELMLDAITKKFRKKLCLYIEFSDISKKMFGYRYFRNHEYFPVRWMQIHNNLITKDPKDRLTDKMLNRIEHLYKSGVVTSVSKEKNDIDDFYKMLRNYYRFKFQRFLPKKAFFEQMILSDKCHMIVTKYKKWLIGGCVLINNNNDTFLWYSASKRKSFHLQHPGTMTIWYSLLYSKQLGYEHLHFMNVGLPFKKNPKRDFILRFGGKPASCYRWFRFSISWLNRLLKWIYRE